MKASASLVLKICSFLYMFSVSDTSATVTDCPCALDKHHKIANCSDRSLTRVPECVPDSTRQLILSGNLFTNISDGSFERFGDLEVLNLDHNQLRHLRNKSFEGLNNLKTLSLRFNQLKYNISFPEDVFAPLKNIENLFIQGNCDGIECSYPDRTLSKARTLSYLFLDGIMNTGLGEGFKSLNSLRTIIMDSDNGFCNLGYVPLDMFWNLRDSGISHIELYHCRMQSWSPNTFSSLSNLTKLVIFFNRNMRNDALLNITSGLNSTDLKTLNLTQIYPYPASVTLPSTMFEGMNILSLETLDLSSNNILYIDPACIFNLPKTITYISFRDNIIGNVHFLENIYILENLETFDMSFQNHYGSDTNDTVCQDLKNETSSIWQKDAEDLTQFILNASKSETWINTDDVIKLPPNIRTVLMNNIKLDYPIPPVKFGPNKLQYLNASSCMLNAFLGAWYGLDYLEILDLSYNGMLFINPVAFTEFRNLTSLYLQGNKIGKSIQNDMKCETFSRQYRLRELDLSDNIVHGLPDCLFESLRNLKKLSLASNALTSVEFQIDSMVSLEMLDLSDNELKALPQHALSQLDRIARNKDLTVNIGDNKLECGCKQMYFIDWLLSTNVLVLNRNNISCVYENQTVISLANINQISQNLQIECISWIVITACAVTFGSLTLILGFIAIICHRRGKYKYLFRTGRKTLNPYHKLKDENITVNIDAYISYDHDYEVFDGKTLHDVVGHTIYDSLKRKGLRIKIRDELPGNKILSSVIAEELQHCHKVVVFLTPTFCKDFANSHEFHIAALEGIYTNRNTIIPVKVGSTVLDNLLPEMRSFLESEEILPFPDTEEQLGEFINDLENRILRW